MSYDGIDEEAAIRARLADLAGGRILDMEPDDTSIPVDSVGKARPFVVLSIGVPFRKAGTRSFGDGEKDIPYVLTFVVGCYAGDRDSLNALYKEVSDRLVDWVPVPDNDLPVQLSYAYNGQKASSASRPATFGKLAAMTCVINV